MLSPLQRMMMGLPGNPFGLQEDQNSPSPPASGGGAGAAVGGSALPAVAAPMLDRDSQTALFDKMGQMGALLLAAGQRMTPEMRGQILSQGVHAMGNTGTSMLNSAQARLMAAKAQEAQQTQAQRDEFQKKIAADPSILKKLGITPDQYALMGPEIVSEALKAQMSRNPIQDAYMAAQIKQTMNPKWTITGQDEFGRPKYDLVAPGGEIITPAGSSRGSQAGILEQIGNSTGQEALDKLRQINPAIAAEVEGIASSQQPFPTKKMGTPEGAMLNALVSQIAGPSFNAMDFPSRQKAWDQQGLNTPNSSGGIRKNSETALRHFKNLYDNSDLLPSNDWGPASTLANNYDIAMAKRSGNVNNDMAKKLATYNNTLEIGGDEMAKALGIGSEGGREAIKQMFDPSQGKGVVQQKIRNQIKLLGEKLQGQQEDWDRVMGPIGSKRMQIIKPDVAEILNLANEPASKTELNIPAEAIAHLKQNPALRDAFDAKYGSGSSAKVLGQ